MRIQLGRCFCAGPDSAIGGGCTFSRYPQEGGSQATPEQESTTQDLPAALIQAKTTQVTASLLMRTDLDKLTHRLAKRLDNQDAETEIVNEVILSVLTPDRYRLEDCTTRASEAMRNTYHQAIRSIITLMKGVPTFGGPTGRPLAVISFLTRFKAAADKALINEGRALELLPFFVK